MAWSGGVFTRVDGSTGWQDDAAAGIPIQADLHDTAFNDLATDGINQTLNKNGQNAPTANLPMGGFKHTNCANGTADTDYTTLGQVKAGIDTQRATLSITNTTYSANATGAYFRLRKSRGAAPTTNTIVQNGDELGVILFSGANGSGFDDAASIQAAVDDAPGPTNDMPGRLAFFTKADGSASLSERMRITNAGKVGIGTGSPYASLDVSSSFQLGASGTAANNFHFTAETAGAFRLFEGNYGAGNEIARFTSTTRRMGLGLDPLYQLHLSTDSAAKLTTNTWTVTSDARVKTNIQPYTKGLAAIKQINPVSYDYNGKAGTPVGPGGISILAQDLQPVFPECIGTYKGRLEPDDEQDTDILTYQGHAMTFALINAIKELAARVEALEAQAQP
jgi:hypothetical protein